MRYFPCPTRSESGSQARPGRRMPLLTAPLALLLAACQGEPPLGPETPPGIEAATSAKLGRITIALHMRPQVPDDVSFATTGRKLKEFRLDDDPSSGMPNTHTFTNL